MYSGKDLNLIVPTKDRPDRVRQLLTCMAAQTVPPSRIIIVDGAQDPKLTVESVATEFQDRLNITYAQCSPPGQIRQRAKGLELLDPSVPLVGFFDDDIVIEPDGFKTILGFWNQAPPETGGISFNLANIPGHRRSLLRSFLGMSGQPGQVLPSGYNVSVANVENDIKTQWLPGGCTLWRQSVVREFPQTEINTSWAAGEDVRFSYPISKKYPLYVCAAAKAFDTGQSVSKPTPARARFQGHRESVAYMYLVELNRDLSYTRCALMVAVSSIVLLVKALGNTERSIYRSAGYWIGLGDLGKALLSGTSLKSALED